jgi:hypothetical protein
MVNHCVFSLTFWVLAKGWVLAASFGKSCQWLGYRRGMHMAEMLSIVFDGSNRAALCASHSLFSHKREAG